MKIYEVEIRDMRIWMKIEDLEKDLENLKRNEVKDDEEVNHR